MGASLKFIVLCMRYLSMTLIKKEIANKEKANCTSNWLIKIP